MKQYTPPHKHSGDVGKPGQIVNPVNTDMMDDMGSYASPKVPDEATNVTWTCDPPLPTKNAEPSFRTRR